MGDVTSSGSDAFRDDLEALMDKHDVPLMIILAREGRDLRTLVFASNPVDAAAAGVMSSLIDECLTANKMVIGKAAEQVMDEMARVADKLAEGNK